MIHDDDRDPYPGWAIDDDGYTYPIGPPNDDTMSVSVDLSDALERLLVAMERVPPPWRRPFARLRWHWQRRG